MIQDARNILFHIPSAKFTITGYTYSVRVNCGKFLYLKDIFSLYEVLLEEEFNFCRENVQSAMLICGGCVLTLVYIVLV